MTPKSPNQLYATMAPAPSKSSGDRRHRTRGDVVHRAPRTELPGYDGVDLRSHAECCHGCNETFASQARFLRRAHGRKQHARAEEIRGVAASNARRLFAVRHAFTLLESGEPHRRPAFQTHEDAPQQTYPRRGIETRSGVLAAREAGSAAED